MFNNFNYDDDLNVAYSELIENTNALIQIESNKNANLANSIAMLNYFLDDINWVGIYVLEDSTCDLVLSHFNGLPACSRLRKNIGVCQSAINNKRTVIVDDVNDFENHIACDSQSKSELVIPIFKTNGEIYGVLDIDSPSYSRFSKEDKVGLENFCKHVLEYIINE